MSDTFESGWAKGFRVGKSIHNSVVSVMIADAVKAEREECAKVCESEGRRVDASWSTCAYAIRARNEEV